MLVIEHELAAVLVAEPPVADGHAAAVADLE